MDIDLIKKKAKKELILGNVLFYTGLFITVSVAVGFIILSLLFDYIFYFIIIEFLCGVGLIATYDHKENKAKGYCKQIKQLLKTK